MESNPSVAHTARSMYNNSAMWLPLRVLRPSHCVRIGSIVKGKSEKNCVNWLTPLRCKPPPLFFCRCATHGRTSRIIEGCCCCRRCRRCRRCWCCCCSCHSTMLVADGNAHFFSMQIVGGDRKISQTEKCLNWKVCGTPPARKKGNTSKKNCLFLRFVKLLVVLYWYARHLLFLLNVMFSTGFFSPSRSLAHFL